MYFSLQIIIMIIIQNKWHILHLAFQLLPVTATFPDREAEQGIVCRPDSSSLMVERAGDDVIVIVLQRRTRMLGWSPDDRSPGQSWWEQ